MFNKNTLALRHDIAVLYGQAPWSQRLLGALRPLICPFDEVLNEVLPTSARVLDIGCGNGLLLNVLAHRKKIASGQGVDINPAALAIAQRVATRFGFSHLTFDRITGVDSLPSDVHDVILMVDVLHHVPRLQQQKLFLAAASRLAPRGRLIYKDMAAQPLGYAAVNGLHDFVVARQIIHHVPLARVQGWAAEAGLRTLRQGAKRYLAYAHEWLVLEKRP